MGKTIISSLFTYDPLISLLNNKTTSSETEEIDFNSFLFERLSRIVISEMVQSIMLCAAKKELDNLILVMDKTFNTLQDEALKIITQRLEGSVNVNSIKVDGNDIIAIAREVVKFIDESDFEKSCEEITINISSLRHEKTLGMIFAAYARPVIVKEIIYVSKEDRRVIKIPILPIHLTIRQKRVLEYLKQVQEKKVIPGKNAHVLLKIERSSFYGIKKTLLVKGLIDNDETVTELGEIALL
jgi:hypothetical protein